MLEQVLVFPKRILDDRLKYYLDKPFVKIQNYSIIFTHGMTTAPFLINSILSSPELIFMDRAEAERNFDYLQIIPYVLVKSSNEYFRYVRSKKGGENRLHAKHSLGIGGHINPHDGSPGLMTYLKALWRELEEELIADGSWDSFSESMEGLIYNPIDDVGKVHFGIFHVVELPEGTEVKTNEEALAEGRFDTLDGIKKDRDLFESWSQSVIDYYLS